MKSLLLRFFLFLLPVGLVLGLSLSVFLLAREFTSVERVIETQIDHPETLMGFAYGDYTKRYKILMTLKQDPEILTIGTSRSMEFRSGFFTKDTAFYNAAGMDNPSDLSDFIRALPAESRLKTIIVGVDARYLESKPAPSASWQNVPLRERLHRFVTYNWRTVYTDYAKGKFSLSTLIKQRYASNHIGLTALTKQKGFRLDGSYDYGVLLENEARLEALRQSIAERASSIKGGGLGIGYDKELSTKRIEELKRFLDACRERSIQVIGFLPPSPALLNETMSQLPDARATSFKELPVVLTKVFGEYGYRFYDTSDLKTIGGSENELIDLEHTTEKGSLRLLSFLAQKESVLSQKMSTTTVQMLLAAPGDIYAVPHSTK